MPQAEFGAKITWETGACIELSQGNGTGKGSEVLLRSKKRKYGSGGEIGWHHGYESEEIKERRLRLLVEQEI